mmetsp:Transcript_12420/g.20588  ORF Transcript_12420/g.20588 Transcript_12420/m.20588 type:complete len:188 (-) Transcript_12420:198-761(-)
MAPTTKKLHIEEECESQHHAHVQGSNNEKTMTASPSAAASTTTSKLCMLAAISPFSLLLDEIIVDHIFGFIGDGHYRFIAGTSCQLRDLYTRFLQHRQQRTSNDSHQVPMFLRNTATFGRSLVESVSRVKLCLKELTVHLTEYFKIGTIQHGSLPQRIMDGALSDHNHWRRCRILWQYQGVTMGPGE